MSEKYVCANGIRLAYAEFGDPAHPAMVLMMGPGTQLIGGEPRLKQLKSPDI